MNINIEKLIVKFLAKEADLEELKQLEVWISNPENEALFFEFIKTNAFIKMTMSNYDKKRAKANIIRRIKQEKSIFYNKHKGNNIFKYAAAAMIIGVLAATYIFRNDLFEEPIETPSVVVEEPIEMGTDKAILTLEDGSFIELDEDAVFATKNLNSNGKQIVYDTESKSAEKIEYNYLTIPRGGQYAVKLSDGTQVWLNSESQLKYPVSFEAGKPRQVELIYGEAYFDVSPSAKHEGSKFKVFNKSQEIEVLGTEFNVTAYKDETIIYTTLVEGRVVINTSTSKQTLKPNEQSSLNTANNSIDIAKVDVKVVTAWVNGKFIFKGKSLKDITKVLSRWYDVDFEFENKSLEEAKFIGELGKRQNLEKILQLIKNTNYINAYEIKGKKVILK
ncbi:FecR family protein [Flavivirga eckloniae]|uniref:Anti-sigma factor n=1 Tax=Flavivirga eckloniae TaxID=1803846 RepID=A0A2K9PUE2_9FLAO|nr:FecR family protein [Flavivirga eckloniae]AUP80690.1 anti-sigma factor [Flavivirga eckloniae]